MKHNHDQIVEMLNYDPLAEAERLTGHSYKEDGGTSALGLVIGLEANKRKAEVLEFARDTYFGISPGDTLKRLHEEGFVVLATEEFTDALSDYHRGQVDRWYILFDAQRGLLVWLETYGSIEEPQSRINSIKLYFNWRPTKLELPPRCSGGFYGPKGERGREMEGIPDDQLVFAGDYDGREGLFNQIDWLEAHGTFVTPWATQPFLWLLTYANTKVEDYDHEAITAARLALLPESVRRAIKA